MIKKLFFSLVLSILFTISILASGAKYVGSFNAGENINGYGANDHSYISYDFIVPKYGLVEFLPANLFEINDQRGAIQYLIQDFAEKHTQGYFNVRGASGITYRGSLDYPNGWKIHMFPGTYRIKVFVGDSKNRYSMNTIFTPASNFYQFPKTGKSLCMSIEDAILIKTNTLYYDNIGYYASIRDSKKSVQNSRDFFKFTLKKDTDFEIQVAMDSTFISNIGATKINFYIWNSLTNISYSDYLIHYKDTSKNSPKIFHMRAGEYYMHVSGTHSGNYSFKIVTSNQTTREPTPIVEPIATATPITTITEADSCSIDTVWEQKEEYNPVYCPRVQTNGNIWLPFAPWTNGRLGNDGYHDGNSIITRNRYDLRGEKIRVKFSIDGANKYTTAFVGISDLVTGVPYKYLSTSHQWGTTKLVKSNQPIYYQMIIDDNGRYTLSYSYNGYDQSEIYYDRGILDNKQLNAVSNAYIYFSNGDNYGGVDASAMLYEFKIESINDDSIALNEHYEEIKNNNKKSSKGGALGYLFPLLALVLLFFKREN